MKAQDKPSYLLGHKAKPSVGGTDQAGKKHVTFAGSDDVSGVKNPTNTVGLLHPIPDFANLVREAAQDAVRSNASADAPMLPSTSSNRPFTGSHVALLDMGVICLVDDVDVLALRIHSRIVRSLLKLKSDAESGVGASGTANVV